METFISTVEYGVDFKGFNNTGWGCGYVHIPKKHPILIQLLEDDGYGNFIQPKDCPEEITFSEWDKDREYFIIGFDTAHRYNNSSHDENFVTSRANHIKSLVDKYTSEDARKYAQDKIQFITSKYSKYL
jgi:hypothetical protein